MDDIVIGAKTRVLSETAWRPAAALRFATRLPNASNESGLGLDTFDFVNTLLVGTTIGSIRLVENVGLGILSDPTQGDRQNDMVMYGQSLAWALTQATEIVVEVNGHANTRSGIPAPGTDSRSSLRAGTRYARGALRLDAATIAGLTGRDDNVGVTAGVTWVLHGLGVP